jgi:hypothetical protein
MRFGAALAAAIMLAPASAEVIDRVAVSVGNQAITRSEIAREIRLTAFLNREEPDLSPEAKRAAAERLIDQKLIWREMELSSYPAPDLSEVEPMLREIKSVRFGGEQNFQTALERHGVDLEDLKRHLLWQLTVLRFIELRFRPGVQVSESDIEEYFNKQVKEAPGNGKQVSVEDFRDRIEQAITGERADRELDLWLKETRSRARIEFRPEAFQ